MARRKKANRVRLLSRLRKVPHLFQKIVVIHCLIVVTIAAYYSLYKQGQGVDMVAIFKEISKTFVAELLFMFGKTIFNLWNVYKLKKEQQETEEEENGI